MDMNLPKGMLVMLVKRGNEFMIPNGSLQLHAGDKTADYLGKQNEMKKFAHVPTCCAMVPHGKLAHGQNSHIIQLSNSMIFNAETITAMV